MKTFAATHVEFPQPSATAAKAARVTDKPLRATPRLERRDLSLAEIIERWPFINVPLDGAELHMSH